MGRRNEKNRLAHKKKVDDKKNREKQAENNRKERLKEILEKFKPSQQQ